MTFCADSILPKVDRASMFYGLEVRVPFLDKRLIEWSMSQPLSVQSHLKGKKLIKNYVQKHLPGNVLSLPKQGFSVPLHGAMTENKMTDYIRSSGLVKDGIIVSNWMDFIPPYNRFAKYWVLYFVALWYDHNNDKGH